MSKKVQISIPEKLYNIIVLSIIFIGFFISVWVLKEFPITSVIFDILCVTISFLIYRHKTRIFGSEDTRTMLGFLGVSILMAFIVFSSSERYTTGINNFFISGTISEHEYESQNYETGQEITETRYIFKPDNEDSKSMVEYISIFIKILFVGSPISILIMIQSFKPKD